MEGKPRVSVVMPAYNAVSEIGAAIESVLGQTVSDWELVVVDDGSTDGTLAEAGRYAALDGRIRVLGMDAPSGSAYAPRMRAILEASGDVVSPLDADDWVGPRYLERFLGAMERTEADIVYPTQWVDGEQRTNFGTGLRDGVWVGKECVKLTLDGWRINCNGGVIRRDLYLEAFRRYGVERAFTYTDELLTRQLLYLARRVAFSGEKYHYRVNPGSITRRRSRKLFDYMRNNTELVRLTGEWFAPGSEERVLAQRQNFHGIVQAYRLMNRCDFDGSELEYGRRLIGECRRVMDMELLRGNVSPRYMFVACGGLVSPRFGFRMIDLWRKICGK